MSRNDQILLDEFLERARNESAPHLAADDFFDLFCVEQVLKDFALSYAELEDGLVDGGGDGGVDAIYLTVDGELVHDADALPSRKKGAVIELALIQTKRASGFPTASVQKLASISDCIFDLDRPVEEFEEAYNERLVDIVRLFREAHSALLTSFPKLRVRFALATRGVQVHPDAEREAERVKRLVRDYLSDAEVEFAFLGATELLALARRPPRTTYKIRVAENPVASSGEVGFVCLVGLVDYFDFITDEHGRLRRALFEANVRDYQGRTTVNDQIGTTLRDASEAENFWWLNNGITVLASEASAAGKTLVVEDPEIVNGMQTSREIFEHFRVRPKVDDPRTVLVRVVVPEAESSRERIIRATNSQTPIHLLQLRATDEIHRDIEDHFLARDLYYERRKNYYKNQGKPLARIVGIPELAQAYLAIVHGRPADARGRPSSLLKDEASYQSVFAHDVPIEAYAVCAQTLMRVDYVLRRTSLGLSRSERANVRFHVAMHVVRSHLARSVVRPEDLARDVSIPSTLYEDSVARVVHLFREMGRSDRLAKGTAFQRRVLEDAVAGGSASVAHRQSGQLELEDL